MNILAIDTSTDYLSIAIAKGDNIIAKFHKKAGMRHSVLLVPMIDKLLKKAHLKVRGIDCFAVSIGPGSFTGLRIGVSVVKGLAFALKKPVVAVPTLDVIAYNAAAFKGIICPVLDARKNKVYACMYKSDGKTIKKISGYLLLSVKELVEKIRRYDRIVFLGDAVGLMENYIKERSFGCSSSSHPQDQTCLRQVWRPKAEVVARLSRAYIKKRKFVKAEDLEPMYLYSKECDIKGT